MSHFDYFIAHPEQAVRFTPDGFQFTPMAKAAIELDATARAVQTTHGDTPAMRAKVQQGLMRAMTLRLTQEVQRYAAGH